MRRVLSAAVVAAIASLVVVPGAAGWSWPADGPLLRPFSLAADEYAAGQHRGIDVGAAAGEPVRAPAAGIVSFVGPVPSGGRALTIQTGRRLRRDAAPARLGRRRARKLGRGGRGRRPGRRERGRGHDRARTSTSASASPRSRTGTSTRSCCCRRVRRRPRPSRRRRRRRSPLPHRSSPPRRRLPSPPSSRCRRPSRRRRAWPNAVATRWCGAAAGDRAAGLDRASAGTERARHVAVRHVRPALARTASMRRADSVRPAAPPRRVRESRPHCRRGRACGSHRRAAAALGAASQRGRATCSTRPCPSRARGTRSDPRPRPRASRRAVVDGRSELPWYLLVGAAVAAGIAVRGRPQGCAYH